MTDFAALAPPLDGRIELRIPASPQWVRVARLTVAGVASRLHFGIADIEDIKLATAEAINNAILHAETAPGEETCVSIVLESDEHGLWISVADQGRLQNGFNAPENPSHETSRTGAASSADASNEAHLPEGGMGLLLIRSLMDEVTHHGGAERDTVVKMFKRLPSHSTPRVAVRGA